MKLTLPSLSDLLPAGRLSGALLTPRYPRVAFEVRSGAVSAVRLQRQKGKIRLAAHSRRPLEEGVVGASLFQPELADPARLEFELRSALEPVQSRGGSKVSLALPDSLAKVVILDLPDLPRRSVQAREMIRWKVRRTIPFRAEDAVLSYQLLPAIDGRGARVLAVVAPRKVVEQYEGILEGMGLRAGLIDISSFNVYNALRAAVAATVPPEADHALVNATETSFTLLIFRGESLLFYRCKNYHVGGGFQGEESLRVVQRELRSSLSYYREKLGGEELAHTFVRTVGLDPEALLAQLARVGLDPAERADAQLSVGGLESLEPEVSQELLPALGLALGRAA